MKEHSEGYIEAKRIERERQERLTESLAGIFTDETPWVLEIGCGHGHYLTDYAQEHPKSPCIGIDVINKRIEKANSKKDKRGLANLSFIKAEAIEFLTCLPKCARFHTVFLLFPDPWPKKRHHKNRFIQPEALSLLASRCTENALFCFRTDHEKYFQWAVEHVEAHPEWHFDKDTPWPFEAGSYFQDLMSEYQSFAARATKASS